MIEMGCEPVSYTHLSQFCPDSGLLSLRFLVLFCSNFVSDCIVFHLPLDILQEVFLDYRLPYGGIIGAGMVIIVLTASVIVGMSAAL